MRLGWDFADQIIASLSLSTSDGTRRAATDRDHIRKTLWPTNTTENQLIKISPARDNYETNSGRWMGPAILSERNGNRIEQGERQEMSRKL